MCTRLCVHGSRHAAHNGSRKSRVSIHRTRPSCSEKLGCLPGEQDPSSSVLLTASQTPHRPTVPRRPFFCFSTNRRIALARLISSTTRVLGGFHGISLEDAVQISCTAVSMSIIPEPDVCLFHEDDNDQSAYLCPSSLIDRGRGDLEDLMVLPCQVWFDTEAPEAFERDDLDTIATTEQHLRTLARSEVQIEPPREISVNSKFLNTSWHSEKSKESSP